MSGVSLAYRPAAEVTQVSDDWIQEALRDFQDAITRGAYEGIRSLDEKGVDRVMEAQARSCVHAYVETFGISADLDLEAFLEKMQFGGSSKVIIERDGNKILWDEQHEGECMCPLVKREVIPLDASLCVCAIHWLRMLVERHVDEPVHVEMLDSVAKGSRNCTFRITIGS